MWTRILLTGVSVGVLAALHRPLIRGFDQVLAWMDGFFESVRGKRWRDAPLALFLLSPVLVILGTFGIAPLFYAVYLSLFNFKHAARPFIALDNYTRALTEPDFWKSLLVTIYYVIGTIPVTMVVSFLIASLLFRIGRGRGFFRTVYFLPYITAVVAAATVWAALLHPQDGPVNAMLEWLGLEPQAWLLESRGVLWVISNGRIGADVGPSLALCCIMLFEIWHSSGFMVVIFLAGLTAIPRDLEDAARIDGAGWWQATRAVTLPILSPTLFFLLVVSTIKAFQAFNSFYAMTGNGRGPQNTTQNLTVYIYANFYEFGRIGYGAAVATLLAIGIVVMTAVQWRVAGRRVHYE
ncbi:MAG TPA: sugar ABC transporter permease [Candidatus Hydrogenedentes bacterium]|nr:sugar ABC transporter permease [Candidatus Hydrogenedentota bacterium]HQH54535.1 sugar ABC transporter permease [Candidatus Hydrogenedentota bacterium]